MQHVFDCRTQLCLVGQEQATMEKLRTQTRHQFAIHPSSISGADPQKIVNRLLGFQTELSRVSDPHAKMPARWLDLKNGFQEMENDYEPKRKLGVLHRASALRKNWPVSLLGQRAMSSGTP